MRKIRGLVLGTVFCTAILFAGCGTKVSHKTPEAVVKSLISAYQNQDEEAVKKCFGLDLDKKTDDAVQKEMNYNMKYFEAHEADKVKFEKADTLGTADKKKLVYVWYNYEVEIKKEIQEVPALSFYYVKEKDKKYYAVPAKDVTDEMIQASRENYQEFVKIEDYKKYEKEYEAFIRKNPKYENSLQNKFKELSR